MMAKAYREGDWFAVPLGDGHFAVGVIARTNPNGVLLGYFFGPRRSGVPEFDVVAHLSPADAVLVGKFGDLGLIQGRWPILGRQNDWDRHAWPMPVFTRFEELTSRAFRVHYDDDNPNKVVREEQVAPEEIENLPEDGLMGARFTEQALAAVLTTPR